MLAVCLGAGQKETTHECTGLESRKWRQVNHRSGSGMWFRPDEADRCHSYAQVRLMSPNAFGDCVASVKLYLRTRANIAGVRGPFTEVVAGYAF
ncbi:hypothetical protein O181_104504 [Austropuccinia psidii MF-1]|uniref:Uncharacterized protein n=1 Tax=Austropuccinia psidii MF-1 TaxID=1389203 RepID=A0A9Q3JN96_9BASI|nr:hypothetical protein [Austropuccinia psidii MF-1]